MNDISKTNSITLIADLCHNWDFKRYQSAVLDLVEEALKKESFEVTFTCNKVKLRGALEVYLDQNGEKTKVFSMKESGNWLDNEQVIKTLAIIKTIYI